MQQTPQLKSSSPFPRPKSTASDKHERSLALYAEGQFESAAELLRQALLDAPTSELANDCAAAELACGHREQALAGFFLATSLNPQNVEAVANLGTLLAHMDRVREAIPHLQKAASEVKDPGQRAALGRLLAECGNKLAERVLQESRNAQQPAVVPAPRQPTAPQPMAAPTLRPPVYMGNNIALLCTTNYNKMYVDTRDLLIAPWLLIHGEWEPEETELLKKIIKPGDVFVDVGANLGYYALLAARVGASHVYAFEAQPSTYELLGKNVIINWMTKFITYEHLAVYSHTTDLEFSSGTTTPATAVSVLRLPISFRNGSTPRPPSRFMPFRSTTTSPTSPGNSTSSRLMSKVLNRRCLKGHAARSPRIATLRFCVNGVPIRWRPRARIPRIS